MSRKLCLVLFLQGLPALSTYRNGVCFLKDCTFEGCFYLFIQFFFFFFYSSLGYREGFLKKMLQVFCNFSKSVFPP